MKQEMNHLFATVLTIGQDFIVQVHIRGYNFPDTMLLLSSLLLLCKN